MSIRVMTQVWDHSKHHSSALLLLLAIADFADDGGRAYPSVETLAKKIRLGERQTQKLLRLLEVGGELTIRVNAGPHSANLYWVTVGGVHSSAPPVNSLTGRGELQGRKGVNPSAPKPSLNHHEPSKAIASRKDDGLLRSGTPQFAAWLAKHAP